MKDPVLRDIPDYGDLITINEFKNMCECGGLIDYDGFGNYAFETKMSDVETHPSKFLKNPDKRFTHIVWFNR